MTTAPLSGCTACFGLNADAVWHNRSALTREVEIADESHFQVTILGCPACGQAFASVFCETIDWSGGDDPHDSLLIPVTDEEADALDAAGADGVEPALRALAPERRYLVRSFPRDAAQPEARWTHGRVWLPRHD